MSMGPLKYWKKQLSNVFNIKYVFKNWLCCEVCNFSFTGYCNRVIVLFTVSVLGYGLEFNMKESCDMGKPRVDIKNNCIKL